MSKLFSNSRVMKWKIVKVQLTNKLIRDWSKYMGSYLSANGILNGGNNSGI